METRIKIKYPVQGKYCSENISRNRTKIKKDFMAKRLHGKKDLQNLTAEDIEWVTVRYDKLFFHYQITRWCSKPDNKLKFHVSRATRNAGLCEYSCLEDDGEVISQDCKIHISWTIIKKLFRNKNECFYTNGMKCFSRLDAFLSTLEHELLHFLIFASPHVPFRGSTRIYGEHGLLFMNLAKAYFGHSKHYHELLVPKKSIKNSEYEIGQKVQFKFNRQLVSGRIVKLNPKRARIQRRDRTHDIYYHQLITCE